MFTMEVIFNHKQFSHFKVAKNNSLLSWITAVYESLIPCLQKQLWDNLESLAGMVRGPWLVVGGGGLLFYPLCVGEKKGAPLEAPAFVDHSVDGFTLISSMICLLMGHVSLGREAIC